jgi:hypothetical protein
MQGHPMMVRKRGMYGSDRSMLRRATAAVLVEFTYIPTASDISYIPTRIDYPAREDPAIRK